MTHRHNNNISPKGCMEGGGGNYSASPPQIAPTPPPNKQQLTSVAVCQAVEAAGNVPAAEQANHLGLHVAIGGLGGHQKLERKNLGGRGEAQRPPVLGWGEGGEQPLTLLSSSMRRTR